MAAADKTKVRRYMVATQDGEVRSILRTIPGVPVLYANKVTLILEPPSEASRRFSAKVCSMHARVFDGSCAARP